jgi:hypothetical protein
MLGTGLGPIDTMLPPITNSGCYNDHCQLMSALGYGQFAACSVFRRKT